MSMRKHPHHQQTQLVSAYARGSTDFPPNSIFSSAPSSPTAASQSNGFSFTLFPTNQDIFIKKKDFRQQCATPPYPANSPSPAKSRILRQHNAYRNVAEHIPSSDSPIFMKFLQLSSSNNNNNSRNNLSAVKNIQKQWFSPQQFYHNERQFHQSTGTPAVAPSSIKSMGKTIQRDDAMPSSSSSSSSSSSWQFASPSGLSHHESVANGIQDGRQTPDGIVTHRKTLISFRGSSPGTPSPTRKRRSLGNNLPIFTKNPNDIISEIMIEDNLKYIQKQQQPQPPRRHSSEKPHSPICDISLLNAMYQNRFSAGIDTTSTTATAAAAAPPLTEQYFQPQKKAADTADDGVLSSSPPKKQLLKYIDFKRTLLVTPEAKTNTATLAQRTDNAASSHYQQRSATPNCSMTMAYNFRKTMQLQRPYSSMKQSPNQINLPSANTTSTAEGTFLTPPSSASSSNSQQQQHQQNQLTLSQRRRKASSKGFRNSRGFPYLIQFNEDRTDSISPFIDNSPLESWSGATDESSKYTTMTESLVMPN